MNEFQKKAIRKKTASTLATYGVESRTRKKMDHTNGCVMESRLNSLVLQLKNSKPGGAAVSLSSNLDVAFAAEPDPSYM